MKLVKDIMTRKVITVSGTATVGKVSQILIHNQLSGVPVTDRNNKLIGFISERDIIKHVRSPQLIKKKAADIMVRDFLAVEEDTPLEHVSKIFSELPYRRLPVIRNGKVVGIISRRDVIDNFLTNYY